MSGFLLSTLSLEKRKIEGIAFFKDIILIDLKVLVLNLLYFLSIEKFFFLSFVDLIVVIWSSFCVAVTNEISKGTGLMFDFIKSVGPLVTLSNLKTHSHYQLSPISQNFYFFANES